MPKTIAAVDYNRIRLGLLRERLPLHVQIKGFRCLQGILDESAWVCVDECQNSQPILTWTNFKNMQRPALDAPVECELRLYHMQAGLIMGTVVEALAQAVAEHYKPHPNDHCPTSKLKN